LHTAQTKAEVALIRTAFGDGHELGPGRPSGHVLWQGVYEYDEESGTERLVAALCWAAASWALKDRDEWIGWDALTRGRRLKLIVQLRRFLVLEEARRPNLASRCLGLALRRLPGEWKQRHGYAPLLAESFSDPESHAGTLYKVTNWTALGETKGYSRSRADFYTDAKRPKLLWVRPLHRRGRELLGSPGKLPPGHAAGETDSLAGARSPLKCAQLESLSQALRRVEDTRSRRTRRHPLNAILSIVCLGLLAGAQNVKDCWRKAGPLTQAQRAAIGLMRRSKKSGRLTIPDYTTIVAALHRIDEDHLAGVLNEWLAANEGILPRSLSIDGKEIKNIPGGIITLCHQQTGAPVAMKVHHKAKEDCEMTEARKLLEEVQPSLGNALVSADALHCQRQTAQIIRRRGGEYLLAMDDNQKTLKNEARRRLAALSPPR
jgi:hypothetical protein